MTPKQQLFVEEYLKCWNATEAARRAAYQGSDATLAVIGWENLRKPKIRRQIKRRLAERAMSADEVLARLADQARGSIEDFITFQEGIKQPFLDLEKANEKKLLHLVKKLKYNARGQLEIELHDAQAAQRLIGQHHGLFVEKHEHSGLIQTEDVTFDDTDRAERIANLFSQVKKRTENADNADTDTDAEHP